MSSSLTPISAHRAHSAHDALPDTPPSLRKGSLRDKRVSFVAHRRLSAGKERISSSDSKLPEIDPISPGQLSSELLEMDAKQIVILQRALEGILRNQTPSNVEMYQSGHFFGVFSIKDIENVIFKFTDCRKCDPEARFRNHLKAFEVVREFQLEHLVVPKIRKLRISIAQRIYTVIAEEKLEIDHGRHLQQVAYERAGERLNFALADLVLLICKTKLADIKWENVPIIKAEDGDDLKIGLVDLEDMGSAKFGLFGEKHYALIIGLVRCVSESQGEMIIELAKQYLKWDESLEEMATTALSDRKKELVAQRQVKVFHEVHEIRTGVEEVAELLDELALDEGKTLLCNKIIKKINTGIAFRADSSPTMPVINRRRIYVFPAEFDDLRELPKDFLSKSLEILLENERICQVEKREDDSWFVQA